MGFSDVEENSDEVTESGTGKVEEAQLETRDRMNGDVRHLGNSTTESARLNKDTESNIVMKFPF